MNVSKAWGRVLKQLATYGDDGINERAFCDLMSGDDHSYRDGAKAVLDQMYFTGTGYVQSVPGTVNCIRITAAGRAAIGLGDSHE